jgi:ATP-dependent Clp protease ATP-binding subunit ClpA
MSIQVVIQLAGQEALAARFGEVVPEHILTALMKLVELPVQGLAESAPEAVGQLTAEVHAIRHELSVRGIDSTQARRRLRAELGRGTCERGPGPVHRSQAAKRGFDDAARLAHEEHAPAMTAVHLLKALLASPTPAMVKVLGEAVAARAGTVGGTPLLDANGIDLAKVAAEDKLMLGPGKPADVKALCRSLVERSRTGILVIGEEEPVCEAMAAAAKAIGRGTAPPALKGIRIVDVTGVRAVNDDRQRAVDALGRMVDEAVNAGRIVLVLPPLPVSPRRDGGDSWITAIKSILADGKLTCLLPVTPEQYAAHIQQDRDWRRLAHAVWIGQAPSGEVPTEL